MIRSLKRLLGKSTANQHVEAATPDILASVVENEIAALRMQQSAREEKMPCVILEPAVPLPAADTAGWFGGTARLPEHHDWPEIDGTPLCFLAQIDLAKMPQNIWSGVGPRSGQLAFFIHPDRTAAKVLHVDGNLIKRDGPSPVSSCWFRQYYDKRDPVRSHWPEWPVTCTGHTGELPEPSGWRKGHAPNFPAPFPKESLDLANPAHHPFDEATLNELIKIIAEAYEKRLASISRFLESRKLRERDQTAMLDLQSELQSGAARFDKITEDLAPFRAKFDNDGIAPFMQALSELPMGNFKNMRTDEDGFSEVAIHSAKRRDPGRFFGGGLGAGFLPVLNRHARYAYLENPDRLKPEARKRFETIWAFDAKYERGGMSHPPKGFIYTPHGPNSGNEVLLELKTSDLVGWIWGDMYSVVLIIARDDLANGKFGNIMVDITN